MTCMACMPVGVMTTAVGGVAESGVGGGLGGRSRSSRRSSAFELGLVFDLFHFLFADHVDGDLDEVADDGFDVAADVADLGELARLRP